MEFISSKSSEMNVMVPRGNGDYVSLTCTGNLYTFVQIFLIYSTSINRNVVVPFVLETFLMI